jgi:hypothetical protein
MSEIATASRRIKIYRVNPDDNSSQLVHDQFLTSPGLVAVPYPGKPKSGDPTISFTNNSDKVMDISFIDKSAPAGTNLYVLEHIVEFSAPSQSGNLQGSLSMQLNRIPGQTFISFEEIVYDQAAGLN